jgi:hypothetical protein
VAERHKVMLADGPRAIKQAHPHQARKRAPALRLGPRPRAGGAGGWRISPRVA